MSEHQPHQCQCNDGIHCDVKNCVWHDGKCTCTADKVQVGPSFAISSADTICSTFRAKD